MKKYYQYYKYIPILQIFKCFPNLKRKSGFTIVELIIFMGILLVLILVLTEILYSVLNAGLSSQSTSSTTRDGRYIYSRLIYDINRAQSASVPANLGDSSQTLNLQIDGINYIYSLNGQNLKLTENTGNYVMNSPDITVSNLQFRRIGNVNGKHTFQINFTVTSEISVNNRFDTQNFQTTAGFR